MRRNRPEEPDACDPNELRAPEFDMSLFRDCDAVPDDPPDDDNKLDPIEPELFHVPELKLSDTAESHAVNVVVVVGFAIDLRSSVCWVELNNC